MPPAILSTDCSKLHERLPASRRTLALRVSFNPPTKGLKPPNEPASFAAPGALPVTISDPRCAGHSGRVQRRGPPVNVRYQRTDRRRTGGPVHLHFLDRRSGLRAGRRRTDLLDHPVPSPGFRRFSPGPGTRQYQVGSDLDHRPGVHSGSHSHPDDPGHLRATGTADGPGSCARDQGPRSPVVVGDRVPGRRRGHGKRDPHPGRPVGQLHFELG